MPPESDQKIICTIAKLEKEIGEHAVSVLKDRRLTPHDVLEYFKTASEKNDDLTILGQLIDGYLCNPKLFACIGWVTFHFAFPPGHFDLKEIETRNWVSIKKSQQELLDCVHEETIAGEGSYERVSRIYAPSTVAKLLEEKNEPRAETVLRKWWLYHFSQCASDCNDEHNQCFQLIPEDSDIICFAESSSKIIQILSCIENPSKLDIPSTLGKLIGIDESAAADSFKHFANLIRERDSAKQYVGDAHIKSTHYARLPLFFHSRDRNKRYRTEVYVAFNAVNTETVVKILKHLKPLLRLCVTIVNSHIAYTLGESRGVSRERVKVVGRATHAISTPLRSIAAKVYKLPLDEPQKKALEHQVTSCINLERFVRELHKRKNSDDYKNNLLVTSSAEKFLSDVKGQLKILSDIFEDREVAIASKVVKALTKEDSFFLIIEPDLYDPKEYENINIDWCREQAYVIADGLIANALKYHSLKKGESATSAYASTGTAPYFDVKLRANVDGKKGLFLVVENDTCYDRSKLDYAKTQVKNLNDNFQIDWIGVSLLHLASEAMGYERPSWEVIKSEPYIRFRALGQIGLIKKS